MASLRCIAAMAAASTWIVLGTGSEIAADGAPGAGADDEQHGSVHIDVIEGMEQARWPTGEMPVAGSRITDQWQSDVFAISGLPQRYSAQGLREDRSPLFMIRASAAIRLPAGEHRLLLRSMNAAQVRIGGQVYARTRFISANTDGHEQVPDIPRQPIPGTRRLPVGHSEQIFSIWSDGTEQVFVLEAFVGGPKLRPEVGELSVSRMTDERGWEELAETQRGWRDIENARRRRLGEAENSYWRWRHDLLRESEQRVESPPSTPGYPRRNEIDDFVNRRLARDGLATTAQIDDLAFLRRVSLDLVGQIPTLDEIDTFLSDDAAMRRRLAIDRLLENPRWADHAVGYWQDVLAENPGILKPKINNTGPFRYWIYESFRDNKPLDRFATELILMQGSRYYGGPAGFELATQNDVPMAAKAQIIAQAFLAVDLECARCHDAPFHPWKQRDLFSLAAMLNRRPIKLPETSSIPLPTDEIEQLVVEVSLQPGSEIEPKWPLTMLSTETSQWPDGLLRATDDPRELLAANITFASRKRFSAVLANRIWQRLVGQGLIEPADDWQDASSPHQSLLDYLAQQLIHSGFDAKQLTRLIVQSDVYGRAAASGPAAFSLAGPAQRRMSAEQVIDSLFQISGKPMRSEPLTLDLDGRRAASSFLNLGVPRRAWEFTSLSNERDRPALSMPVAQSIVDVLDAFGWRASRQSPLSARSLESTVQQPAILANGVLTRRIAGLSDDHRLTPLCVAASDVHDLIDQLYLACLTRRPTDTERSFFEAILADGFDQRRVEIGEDDVIQADEPTVHAVSWSNHLSAEATRIKLRMEQLARQGDPPTLQLTTPWRERAEDVVWALINSPEFLFIR